MQPDHDPHDPHDLEQLDAPIPYALTPRGLVATDDRESRPRAIAWADLGIDAGFSWEMIP